MSFSPAQDGRAAAAGADWAAHALTLGGPSSDPANRFLKPDTAPTTTATSANTQSTTLPAFPSFPSTSCAPPNIEIASSSFALRAYSPQLNGIAGMVAMRQRVEALETQLPNRWKQKPPRVRLGISHKAEAPGGNLVVWRHRRCGSSRRLERRDERRMDAPAVSGAPGGKVRGDVLKQPTDRAWAGETRLAWSRQSKCLELRRQLDARQNFGRVVMGAREIRRPNRIG